MLTGKAVKGAEVQILPAPFIKYFPVCGVMVARGLWESEEAFKSHILVFSPISSEVEHSTFNRAVESSNLS